MECKPIRTKEHDWLDRLLGEWTYECPPPPGHDNPEEKFGGTEVVRALGQIWVVGEGRGPMPGGGEARMMITLGFDPATGRFTGTWVGSMMNMLWVYDGELDETGNKLILESEGPSMTGGTGRAKYRDVIEFINADHRTLTGMMQGEDGEWTTFMTSHYYRIK